jgi:curved DNA-binding protein CbpA
MPSSPSNGDRMYRRLDVAPEASPEQIGRAYRRLAYSLHPDTHPDDPDAAIRFREITEAYEILSDPARRARYDRNRQPTPTSDLRPPRPAAKPGRIRVVPVYAPVRPEGQPVFVGLGPFSTGSPPLIAGPVHIASSSIPPGAAPTPTGSTDITQVIAAVLRAWRW